MTLQDRKQQFIRYQGRLQAYNNMRNLLLYDSATGAPENSVTGRSRTLSILEDMRHDLVSSKETQEMLNALQDDWERLDSREQRMLELVRRSEKRIKSVPAKEYAHLQQLQSEAYAAWHTAKANNNFSMLAPYLEQLFEANRAINGCIAPEKPAYDVCLDQYESGLTSRQCDALFSHLRAKIVPLLWEIRKVPVPAGIPGPFPKAKQQELSRYVMDVMHVDRSRCVLEESEHPGTTSFTKYDVRITTRYGPEHYAPAMNLVMHEAGHALYELHTADEDSFTVLGTFASMSLHESQSRFYENLIGRSREFAVFVTPKLKQLFPEQFAHRGAQDVYRDLNRCTFTPIRLEADELTYSIHIMIRYELEKALMEGAMKVSDLPAAWNELYKCYLGIEVNSDREGVLQDCHWAYGSIGYFPSYALGNAYGAQMLRAMKKTLDVEDLVLAGNLEPINHWLEERVWRHGARYETDVLLRMVCQEDFDPNAYTDYLLKKYTELY